VFQTAALFRWSSGDERKLPGCGLSSQSSMRWSLGLKTDGGSELSRATPAAWLGARSGGGAEQRGR
jgi:hypothetical protein